MSFDTYHCVSSWTLAWRIWGDWRISQGYFRPWIEEQIERGVLSSVQYIDGELPDAENPDTS